MMWSDQYQKWGNKKIKSSALPASQPLTLGGSVSL